jgi:hypothetical protein
MTKKKEPKRPDVERIGEHVEDLPCPLTEPELMDRGARLAQLHSDLAQHEAHSESVKADLKSRKTALEAEASRLAGIVRKKYEPRPVKVFHEAHWQTLTYREVRADTGSVIPGTNRPLREEERQGEIFDGTALATQATDELKTADELPEESGRIKKTIGGKKPPKPPTE